MAALTKQEQELVDRRYAEKVAARAEGRTPVEVAAPAMPKGISPADVDARYQAKLANHGKKPPAADAQSEGGDAEGSSGPYDGLTRAQLAELAKERGIQGAGSLNRAKLVEVLSAADAQSEGGDAEG